MLRLANAACCVGVLSLTACSQHQKSKSKPEPPRSAAVVSTVAHPCVDYRYSVVHCGIASGADVVKAQVDPIVRAHYAAFNGTGHLRIETMEEAVYVSYRKADRIYWTANRVTIRAGELVYEEHGERIRGRCGNRISDTPLGPVEARRPDVDRPVIFGLEFPIASPFAFDLPLAFPESFTRPMVGGELPLLSRTPTTFAAGGAAGAGLPGGWIAAPGGYWLGGFAAVVPATLGGPVADVPEPGSLDLLLAGAVALLGVLGLVVTGRKL